MASEASPTLDPAILQHNLTALRETDPHLVDMLEPLIARLPETAAATTRDGQINLRIRQADRSWTWLGRTSIPLTRADAILSQFHAGTGNVMLAGVGEGTEIDLLLQRLSLHQAVFVWEPEPTTLLLVLTLHDWADAICAGRLVLVVCPADQIAHTLVDCLRQRPGHLCPNRIMVWPWNTPASMASCRSAVEAAYHQIEQLRATELAAARRQLDEPRLDVRDKPAVVILSLHAHPETWAVAEAMLAAAHKLAWHPVDATLHGPAEVHPLARACQLAATLPRDAAFALLMNTYRADVADAFPPSVPAITWIWGAAHVRKDVAAQIGPRDLVAAADAAVAARLSAAGLPAERMILCPLPSVRTSQESSAELPSHPATQAERPMPIAVCGHLPPIDPDAYGITLPSHLRVWNIMLDLLRARIESFQPEHGEELLSLAERKAQSPIDDDQTRCAMLNALTGPVAEHLVWQSLSQALINQHLTIESRGPGWSALPGLTTGPGMVSPAARQRFFRRARLVLSIDLSGELGVDPLLASASGAVLLRRAHPLDNEPGGIATLLEDGREMIRFTRHRDLVQTAKALLTDENRRAAMAMAAIERCRREHPPIARFALLAATATSCFSSHPA